MEEDGAFGIVRIIIGLIVLSLVVAGGIIAFRTIGEGADSIVEENTPEGNAVNTEGIFNQLQESIQESGEVGYSCNFRDRDTAKVTDKMKEHVEFYLGKFGMKDKIPEKIVYGVILQESNGNPEADNGLAKGLMQVVPSTNHEVCKQHCGFANEVLNADYYDIKKNICCGIKILSQKYGATAADRCKAKFCQSCFEKYPQWAEYKGYQVALQGFHGWGCSTAASHGTLCYVGEIENAALKFKTA